MCKRIFWFKGFSIIFDFALHFHIALIADYASFQPSINKSSKTGFDSVPALMAPTGSPGLPGCHNSWWLRNSGRMSPASSPSLPLSPQPCPLPLLAPLQLNLLRHIMIGLPRIVRWSVTSMPSVYAARNSQTSSYEAFSNNMFSIQAHQARVHQRLILASSHDPTRLACLAQNPYKVMCSKCTVTSFSRNTQHFLIAAHTYPSQRHART